MTPFESRHAAVLVAVLLATRAASAEPPPEETPAPASEAAEPGSTRARDLFERGRALLEQDRPAEACAAFAQSHALRPTIATLLNLGVCHRRSGRLATALAYFRQAATASAAEGDEERAAKAAQDGSEVEPLVGTLTLRPDPSLKADVDVWLDGALLARSAWSAAIPLDAGDHRVELRSRARTLWSAHVLVSDGAPSICDLPAVPDAPRRQPSAKPASTRSPVARPGNETPRVPVASYVAGGIGLASFGTAMAFGFIAWEKYAAAETECPSHSCRTSHAGELYDAAVRNATVANVAVAVGAVSLGAGLVFYFTQGRPGERRTAFTVVQHGAGAALRAEF